MCYIVYTCMFSANSAPRRQRLLTETHTRLYHRAWTTVMACTLGARVCSPKTYSAYKTAPRATSSTLHHDRHHYLYSTSCIGYRSRVGYATNYAAWCTDSATTLFLHTYPNYVFPVVILVFEQPLGETTWSLEHRHLANRAFAVAAPSSWKLELFARQCSWLPKL